MHPPAAARQTPQKGQENSPMDLALHTTDLLASTQIPQPHQNHDPQSDTELEPSLCEEPQDDELPDPLPLMHFPHCRLEITTFPTPNGPGKLEQIALPGSLVRTLLSRFETDLQQHQEEEYQYQQQRQQHRRTPSPSPAAAAASKPHSPPSPPTTTTTTTPTTAPRPVRIQPHFDDAADWVFSRCLLADFTGFREDEAEALSTAAGAGRLCCWASVVLSPPRRRRSGAGTAGVGGGGMGFGGIFGDDEDELAEEEEEEGLRGLGGVSGVEGEDEGRWELEFVVQRVGVRDPGSGWSRSGPVVEPRSAYRGSGGPTRTRR
ncbi:hypothetical protein F5144DRAFT_543447 [Chaetomium tenue]|uniref:Uncharacterized protein n=1 Tax=Chaetomium tenue TaxID=1854479 RepID=A0ACB7PSP1_9PEZI|nr:hypothetical protein F5144DRAFT_543447 [Chaetomium globosum]